MRACNTPMYLDYLYHLDLCILAYQLYNQTLIWPLDPYYERLARKGSSRRDNFIAETHRHIAQGAPNLYRGPGATRGWSNNANLDPIVTRYERIFPWRACFTFDASQFRVFQAPSSITDEISAAYVCEYTSDPGGDGISFNRGAPRLRAPIPNPTGGGQDVLYAFEGGTGATGQSRPAWSLMGYVLNRRTAAGHDVHIVFRGSQSGSAGRAAMKGMLSGAGNPDWVTDMDSNSVDADPRISRHGSVCRGFKNSVNLCINSIVECLSDIDQHGGGAPQNIFVAGHSLGGALAAQFASAMACGQYGQQLPGNLRIWPWSKLKLFTYGCPAVGGFTFHTGFNLRVSAKRITLYSDAITTAPRNYHVGSAVLLEGGGGYLSTAAHEPARIRQCLIQQARTWGDPIDARLAEANEPWKVYPTFLAMCRGNAGVRAGFRQMLTGSFVEDTRMLMDIFHAILSASSSYKTWIRHGDSSDRQDRLTRQFADMQGVGEVLSWNAVKRNLRARIEALRGVQDDMDRYISMCLVLSALVSSPRIPLEWITEDPVLQGSLSC